MGPEQNPNRQTTFCAYLNQKEQFWWRQFVDFPKKKNSFMHKGLKCVQYKSGKSSMCPKSRAAHAKIIHRPSHFQKAGRFKPSRGDTFRRQ